MDAINLADHLLKRIRERKARLSEAILDGSISSWDEYRFVVGQIRGVTHAEEEIRAAMRSVELDDD